jgi:MerR family transcriptional regulator, light-induced transcriptional regulator
MTNANPLAAEILEASAAGYASAASLLLQQSTDRPAGLGSSEWKSHLTQRILELAAAVRLNKPELFARRISWLRKAVRARGAAEGELRAALESIRSALDRELPDRLRRSVEEPIRLAFAALDAEIEPDEKALDGSTAEGRLGLEYLTACLEARADDAIALILDEIEAGRTIESVYADVLLPAQREIGQLWHAGDATIGEERLVSEATRTAMTLIVHRYAPPSDARKTVLSASVAGNAHDIGLRAVADLLRLKGCRSVFLGANMPTGEIASSALAFDAKLTLLSASLSTQISTIGAVIDRIRQVAGDTKILVGGLAFENAPDLWHELGADAYGSDVRSAVATALSLIAND